MQTMQTVQTPKTSRHAARQPAPFIPTPQTETHTRRRRPRKVRSDMAMAEYMRSGGLKLRQAREARQMTQLDVERATTLRYGAEGRVQAQQVSRIEKGNVDKPPILDLLRIGEVLGLQPDDIAEMFGLWQRQSGEPMRDERVREFESLLDQVPFDLREKMLMQLEVVVALTRTELRMRLASATGVAGVAGAGKAGEAAGAGEAGEDAGAAAASQPPPPVRPPRTTRRGRPPMRD